MPVSITTGDLITLWRGALRISQHREVKEAIERAIAHSEANGPGSYEIRFPNWTVSVSLPTSQSNLRQIYLSLDAKIRADMSALKRVITPVVSTAPFFFDDFNYTLPRVATQATKLAIVQAEGYTIIQDSNSNADQRAKGYIHTVAYNAIPGHESTPSPSTSRVLCIECLPTSSQLPNPPRQTDLYLRLGNGTPGSLPAEMWMQFWLLVNRTGTQMSEFNHFKFMYPLHTGDLYAGDNTPGGYPLNASEVPWLLNADINVNSSELQPAAGCFTWVSNTTPMANGTARATWTLGSDNAVLKNNITLTESGTAGSAERQYNSKFNWPNLWVLHKFHFGIAGATGIYEHWNRPYGYHAQGLKKKAEFIVGTTTGLTNYNLSDYDRQGPLFLSFPTTVGQTPAAGGGPDSWFYMADLAIATSESGLPTYSSF